MRARTSILIGLFVVASSLTALSLLGSTTNARQKPEKEKDQQVTVSRESLREIAADLAIIRDSLYQDLGRLETEYLQARQNGAKVGDPKEVAIKAELVRQRENFNRLVDQLKRLQLMSEGK